MKKLYTLLALLSFIGCESNQPPVELTILHTNDIHSHLHAERSDPFGLGGLSRLTTLIKNRRAAADLSLTVDAGDFSEGSWHFSVDAGSNMLRALSIMGFSTTV